MIDKSARTYSQLHSGKEVTIELPFRYDNGYSRDGKKKVILAAPSLNIIIALSKRYMVWNNYKARAEELIGWEIKRQTREHFDKPVAIMFQRYAIKLLDWDNGSASFKIIGDTLVSLGIIPDDTPEWIAKFFPEQYKVSHKADEKIIIKIWEYNGINS